MEDTIESKMRKEYFIEKAKKYLESQSRLDSAQWEQQTARQYGVFNSIEDILGRVNHNDPNIRILTIQMLDKLSPYLFEHKKAVKSVLSPRLEDNHSNNIVYAGFQCEDNENITVSSCAADALKSLDFEDELEKYVAAIDSGRLDQRKNPDKRFGDILDLLDSKGTKLGYVLRKVAEENGDWHKTAHILIFSDSNYENLVLQLRGKGTQSELQYCQTASGHVMYGETYLEAARKEINEELLSDKGIPKEILDSLDLRCMFKYEVRDEKRDNREWVALYTAVYPGELSPDKNEVKGIERISFSQLLKEIETNPKKYTASFKRDIGFLLADKNNLRGS